MIPGGRTGTSPSGKGERAEKEYKGKENSIIQGKKSPKCWSCNTPSVTKKCGGSALEASNPSNKNAKDVSSPQGTTEDSAKKKKMDGTGGRLRSRRDFEGNGMGLYHTN